MLLSFVQEAYDRPRVSDAQVAGGRRGRGTHRTHRRQEVRGHEEQTAAAVRGMCNEEEVEKQHCIGL